VINQIALIIENIIGNHFAAANSISFCHGPDLLLAAGQANQALAKICNKLFNHRHTIPLRVNGNKNPNDFLTLAAQCCDRIGAVLQVDRADIGTA